MVKPFYKNSNHSVLSWIMGNHLAVWLGTELCCVSHTQCVSPKFLFSQITEICNLINGFLVCGDTGPVNISCFPRRLLLRRLEDVFCTYCCLIILLLFKGKSKTKKVRIFQANVYFGFVKLYTETSDKKHLNWKQSDSTTKKQSN